MWRTWLFFDFKKAFIALHVFLAVMALTIHFILLSTDRYNWLAGPAAMSSAAEVVPAQPVTDRMSG
jgi:light-harvesting complex 1 alpha chain